MIPTEQSVESLVNISTGVAVVPQDFKDQEVPPPEGRAEAEAKAEAEAEAKAAEAATGSQRGGGKPAGKGHCGRALAANPIVQLNAAGLALAVVVLGVGAYRRHQSGALSWKLAGTWGLVVAALAGADFCLSSFLAKKYPLPKKDE